MVQLRAAACKVNITPKDEPNVKKKLEARILVLETDGTSVAIVSLDSCFANDTLFKHKFRYSPDKDPAFSYVCPTLEPLARTTWAGALGGPADTKRLFVSATHTHSASTTIGGNAEQDSDVGCAAMTPNDATEDIRKAIERAKAELKPATLTLTKKNGRHDDAKFGSPGLTRLRRPNLEPQSPGRYPIDDTLVILQVRAEASGNPIAFLVNYGVHGTLWSLSKQLSPDFLGEGMSIVEEKFEKEGVVPCPVSLFIQGCSGDVTPVYPEPWERRGDYAVVKAWGGYLANHVIGGITHGVRLQPSILRVEQEPFFPTIRENYGGGKPSVIVSGIRLAPDTVLLGVSGELFSDYRAKIEQWASAAPFLLTNVIVAGLTNGYSGYLPTAIDFGERTIKDRNGTVGYELSVTPYTAAIEGELRAAVTKVLALLTKPS